MNDASMTTILQPSTVGVWQPGEMGGRLTGTTATGGSVDTVSVQPPDDAPNNPLDHQPESPPRAAGGRAENRSDE